MLMLPSETPLPDGMSATPSGTKEKLSQDAQQRQQAARMLGTETQRAPCTFRNTSLVRRDPSDRLINFDETPAGKELNVPKTILWNYKGRNQMGTDPSP